MRKLLSVCLVVLFVLASVFSVVAAPSSVVPVASDSNAIDSESLMSGRLPVASGSDALSDEPLDESFSVIPYSSLGKIENTVDYSHVKVVFNVYKGNKYLGATSSGLDSSGYFKASGLGRWPDADKWYMYVTLENGAIPSSGTYQCIVDFSSDFSVQWAEKASLHFDKKNKNATTSRSTYYVPFMQNSGDFQIKTTVDVGSSLFEMMFGPNTDEIIPSEGISGYLKINFTLSSKTPEVSTPGTGAGASAQDFQNGVTNLMGNISDKLVEIVATISDQLKALWDQMYNYMHLEQLKNDDKNTGQIVDAINSQGEQVGQDITNSIDNNTQNIINNNNQNFDNIQNGYDNTGMGADKDKLDSAINGYDKLEDDVVNQVKDNINQFEFKNPFESFTAPMKDIGYFLTGIYNALGALNIPISFSLTLTIALLAIGWYRFKGGA